MTEKKFILSLIFIKNEDVNVLSLFGIQLHRKVPYDHVQFFKNDIIKKQLPIPLIEKMDLKTFLFPDIPINFNRDDKIGIKLIKEE